MSGAEVALLAAGAGTGTAAAGTAAAGTAAAAGAGAAGAGAATAAGTGAAMGAGTAAGMGAGTAAGLGAAELGGGLLAAEGATAAGTAAGTAGTSQGLLASVNSTPLWTTQTANPIAQITANTFAEPAMSMAATTPAESGSLMAAMQNAQGLNAASGAMSVNPYGYESAFTVGDLAGRFNDANKGMSAVNKAMGQPQQQQPMMMDGGGQQQQRQSFGSMVPQYTGQNNFARMLLEQKMRRQQGLLG